MLSRLQVRNYVLIDSLEIDFPEGLIIITGQTGAGKSILLGALGLLMGAKADASMLSEGADNCVVEAEFAVGPDEHDLKDILTENDVEWDEESLIIRRVVNRSGRSRSFVNDSPVPVQVLQEIASNVIDIHSQHQTLLLSDKNFQLDVLDYFAGTSSLRNDCASLWRRLNALKSELAALDAQLAAKEAERDYNQTQYQQLDSANLREGELAELEEEQKALANAEEIKTALCTVEALFNSSDSSGESHSLNNSLKEAEKILSRVGRYVPATHSLSERIASCRLELDDILGEVETLNSRTDVSESRLEQVESRMSLLYGLMQKHGCQNESELISLRERLSSDLSDTTVMQEKRDALMSDISGLKDELCTKAELLHTAREAAAPSFASKMTDSIRGLELPYAIFEVELVKVPVGPSGADLVQFRFAATGRNAVDLAKCASGGEMSRIMLALKAMKARYAKMPTMIFDEIDTGVSGSVADKMGTMICEMGQYMQVFAITHLPQVAAKGNAHYLVSKDIDPLSSTAVSKIQRLSDEQRVLELARMLSGSVLTDAAVANARALLK